MPVSVPSGSIRHLLLGGIYHASCPRDLLLAAGDQEEIETIRCRYFGCSKRVPLWNTGNPANIFIMTVKNPPARLLLAGGLEGGFCNIRIGLVRGCRVPLPAAGFAP